MKLNHAGRLDQSGLFYQSGNSRMIVSNGVGNWFPIRVNAPAELVNITLKKVEGFPSLNS